MGGAVKPARLGYTNPSDEWGMIPLSATFCGRRRSTECLSQRVPLRPARTQVISHWPSGRQADRAGSDQPALELRRGHHYAK
jgi:hypothetical protein